MKGFSALSYSVSVEEINNKKIINWQLGGMYYHCGEKRSIPSQDIS